MTKKLTPENEPVREQVKQMSGHANEEEMADSLPENTMAIDAEEPRPRRKRRSKEEMQAWRASQGVGSPGAPSEPLIDPLMADPRYRKAVEKMRSAGISTTVKAGFKTAAVATDDPAWELEGEEVEDVDDFSYVCSKKYAILDPTQHWVSMFIYFFAMLGTFIFKRAAKAGIESWMKKVTNWFSGESEQPKNAQQIEREKAESL